MGRRHLTSSSNAFGEAFSAYLDSSSMTRTEAAAALGVTKSYVSQVANGKKRVSAKWIETVAMAMKLQAAEKERLMRASAADHGFVIDLMSKGV